MCRGCKVMWRMCDGGVLYWVEGVCNCAGRVMSLGGGWCCIWNDAMALGAEGFLAHFQG